MTVVQPITESHTETNIHSNHLERLISLIPCAVGLWEKTLVLAKKTTHLRGEHANSIPKDRHLPHGLEAVIFFFSPELKDLYFV